MKIPSQKRIIRFAGENGASYWAWYVFGSEIAEDTDYYLGWKGPDIGKFANIRQRLDEDITSVRLQILHPQSYRNMISP